MINSSEILQTIRMFDQQHLDIRTITMGISLLDCADPDPKAACRKVYDKICRRAQNLVATGQTIEKEFGIPIVNKRVSVTPISLVASASDTADYAPFAAALDKAAKTMERAHAQIELEKKQALNDLKNQVSGMALGIASAVLEEEIDQKKHAELIHSFIENLGETS